MSVSSPTPSLTLARSLPQGVDELIEMGPFELFRSQSETGSTEAKVDAMKRLSVVAFAIGSESTLSTLLPYLATLAMKQPPQEDELLINMAGELQKIVPTLLKGAQALPILPILERLAAVEETVVRDEAVKAINHIAPEIEDGPVLVAMAKRLVGADWFTAKVSAAGILPVLYKVSGDRELVNLMKEVAQDETPMVRRGAAANLGHFMSHMKSGIEGMIPILQQLCRDEQDSVRLLAVATTAQVGNSYTEQPELATKVILPIVRAGSTDLSWRVRNNLAKSFSDVATNLGIGGIEKYEKEQALVMACFVALLQDIEAEVRASAVGHLARMVHWGGADLFESHLQPLLPGLADDIVMEVRSKCALALMDSSEGGTLDDSTILQAFGPLLENFLQDEFSEVQLHVLSNLPKMSRLLEKMNGVVSSILNMAKASNWRVREGVAKLLPHLADARGLDFFSQVLLEPAWLNLLQDPVAFVRNAVVASVGQLVTVTGPAWFSSNIIPRHSNIYDQSPNSYLMRNTIIQSYVEAAIALGDTTESTGSEVWQELMSYILEKGLADKVPNVRMVASMGLSRIMVAAPSHSSYIQGKIKPLLESNMDQETDDDCRHFQDLSLSAM
mmetsp:Transcript_12262/g.18980  ORF Transcript_12262/g.18980 Transcript_12262/m.18980 type:complete len:615 (-) Transcript_12262:70-1914(-)|eukprot:CAMPEP_0195282536 /NCGR_PEP_ID=MMETSP0707-20130614/1358_1 /TAXON_ID=33640 /ORGANISM="Asterionellopsis glacialis, Strain CCMP134" /LENGTH=614 /DNA_ID=CAMNT_0040341511 /DNA_START=118 /DNA_END=1962 /DNA_ORIENTATION=+